MATATATPSTRPDGGPLRVLVVDDERAISELLHLALRHEGWDVTTAADGAEALRAARETRPDAVLLDVMLPDVDGLQVLARLRAELPQVPVIFLTAKDAVADRIAGLTAEDADLLTGWLRSTDSTAADGFDQAFGVLSLDGEVAAEQGWMWGLEDTRWLHSAGVLDDGTVVIQLGTFPQSTS